MRDATSAVDDKLNRCSVDRKSVRNVTFCAYAALARARTPKVATRIAVFEGGEGKSGREVREEGRRLLKIRERAFTSQHYIGDSFHSLIN